MPRFTMPKLGNRTSGAPIPVSLTSLKNDGKDNPAFILENDTTERVPNGGTHPATDNEAISVISHNNILTHRNAPKSASSDIATNGGAHPIISAAEEGRGAPNGNPHIPGQTSQTTAVDTPKKDGVEMKKSINLLHMVAILVSVTGHSSIFIAPASILAQAGSIGAALFVWLFGGLIHLGQALCFAELGTMFPGAGGPYAYAMKAFGPLMGFLMMWGYTILIAGPFWAFLARTAAVYILRPVFPSCSSGDIETAITVLAGWIIVTFVVLNCVYMKYVTKVQTLLSSSKLIVLLIILAAGIYYLVKGETDSFQAPFEDTTTEPGQFALALFYATFAYGGWQVMTTMLAEVKNPSRDPPLAAYISFFIVISLYIMANVSYVTLLSPAQVKVSTAVASDFVAEISDVLSIIVSVLVALTSIGALNASIMGHSRLLFAGARNGHMPQILGMVHAKYLTPWPSIFVYTAWALVMLFTGGVVDMMDYISLFSTIMGLVVVGALLYLRWKRPDVERPYKTLLVVPILEMIVNAAVLVLGIYQKPDKMGNGLAIFFAGIPVYWFGVLWKNKPKEFTEIVDNLTAFAQRLFLLTKVNK